MHFALRSLNGQRCATRPKSSRGQPCAVSSARGTSRRSSCVETACSAGSARARSHPRGAEAGAPQPGHRVARLGGSLGATLRRSLGATLELEHRKEMLVTPPITSPPCHCIALHDHHLQITANQFIQLGSKPMTSVVGLLPRRLFTFSTLIMLMGCGGISIVAPVIAVWVSGHCRRGPCCTFQCG